MKRSTPDSRAPVMAVCRATGISKHLAMRFFDAFQFRLASFLDDLDSDLHKHKIIVSHGLPGRVLRGINAGLPKPDIMSPPMSAKAFFHLNSGGGIKEVLIE